MNKFGSTISENMDFAVQNIEKSANLKLLETEIQSNNKIL